MTLNVRDRAFDDLIRESPGVQALQVALAQIEFEGLPIPLTISHPGGRAFLTRGEAPAQLPTCSGDAELGGELTPGFVGALGAGDYNSGLLTAFGLVAQACGMPMDSDHQDVLARVELLANAAKAGT